MGVRGRWKTINFICNADAQDEIWRKLREEIDKLPVGESLSSQNVRSIVYRGHHTSSRQLRYFDFDGQPTSPEDQRCQFNVQVVVDGNIYLHHYKHKLTEEWKPENLVERIGAIAQLPPDTQHEAWTQLEVDIAKGGLETSSTSETSATPHEDSDENPGEVKTKRRNCNIMCNGRCITYDNFFACVFNAISVQVKRAVIGLRLKGRVDVDIVIVFDGVSPVAKWFEQLERRKGQVATTMSYSEAPDAKKIRLDSTTATVEHRNVLKTKLQDVIKHNEAVLHSACRMTAFSDVLHHLQSYGDLLANSPHVLDVVINDINNDGDDSYQISSFTILPPSFTGEGEIKMVDCLTTKLEQGKLWDVSIAVTDDSDALLCVLTVLDDIPARDVYIYSPCQARYARDLIETYGSGYTPELRVYLAGNPAPCRHRGYYHMKDDVWGRFLGGRIYASPLSYIVPMLLYGGFELLPIMISTKRNQATNLKMWNDMIKDTEKESDFFIILKKSLRAVMHYENSATSKRIKNQLTLWKADAPKTVRNLAPKYVKLLYWTCLYATYDKTLNWYSPPIDFMYDGDLGQNIVSKCAIKDILNFLNAGNFDGICDVPRLTIPSDNDTTISVVNALRALNGLYILSALQFDKNMSFWSDLDAICAAYTYYRSLCLCSSAEAIDPRSTCSIFRQNCEWSQHATSKMLQNCYNLTRERLANVLPSNNAFETVMQKMN